jgi:hypothetical protein
MNLDFGEDEVCEEVEEGEDETGKGSNKGKPLIVGEVLALEIRNPVELGHF